MGAFEFILAFTFLAAGILATVGYAVITVTPADFKLARASFLIAGALVFAGGIMWGVLTNSPFWTRVLVVSLIGAVSAVATNEAIRWVNNREKIAGPLPEPETHARQEAQTAPSNDVSQNAENARRSTPATASGVSDPGLFLECTIAIPPIKTPADGRLFILGLFPTPIENGGGGLSEVTMPPGTDYKGGAVDLPLNVHRCQITNYNTVTAVNIDIALSLIFSEVVEPKTGGHTSGSIKLARSWRIRIGKIDPGIGNPFVFHILNQVPFFVQVSFPEEAVIRRIGDPTPQTIQLTTSNHYPISFGPVFEKKADVGVEAKP